MVTDAQTSIPVHASTLKLLQGMKTGGQNWDEFLLELAEKEIDRMEIELGEMSVALYKAGVGKVVDWENVRKEIGTRRKR
jgi:hypothetical protein